MSERPEGEIIGVDKDGKLIIRVPTHPLGGGEPAFDPRPPDEPPAAPPEPPPAP